MRFSVSSFFTFTTTSSSSAVTDRLRSSGFRAASVLAVLAVLGMLAISAAQAQGAPAPVVLNEVHYDQAAGEQEFIELYVVTGPVNLTGWRVLDQDEMTYTLGATGQPCAGQGQLVLATGERLVLWQGAGTSVCTGSSRRIYLNRGTFLQKEGDDVVLRNAAGVCQDYVAFETGPSVSPRPASCAWTGPNPSNGNTAGRSISRFDVPLVDTNRGADWERSGATTTTGPKTPGAVNVAAVVIACTTDANCSDGNPCTDGTCQNPGTPQAVCVQTNNTASCNDNTACTSQDTCSGGVCVGGPNVCASSVYLNEVHYDQVSGEQEFVELYATNGPVDLTGWTLSDQDEMTYVLGRPANPSFPCAGTFTLNAGDRLAIWQGAGTSVCTGSSRRIYLNRGTFLQKEGDDVVLRNAAGVCQDYVAFETGPSVSPRPASCAWTGPNPSNGNTAGRSISRFDVPLVDTNRGADWERSGATTTTGPKTPGAVNVAAVVIACTTDANCSDGNPCTDDVCQNAGTALAACVHSNNTATCATDNNACTDDVCADGACTHPNNTAACDDGNVCTSDDTCNGAGTCVGTNNTATCATDNNACTNDVCADGACTHPNNTAACDDGNECTSSDTCNGAGSCLGTNNTATCATDNNACTNDVCAAGACTHDAIPNCVPCNTVGNCDDGNGCTDDACVAGRCAHTNNTDPCATDNNACTDDVCADGACTHPNNTAACATDDNACSNDVCADGACTHDAIPNCVPCNTVGNCDDGNGCTDDACVAGRCAHTNNTAACDDGNECTSSDTCNGAGSCLGTNNTNPCATDDDACTNDVCADGVCTHDVTSPPTTICRASAGVCDLAESCTSGGCPPDGFEPQTAECRASAGVCDAAEKCTGSSAACPADAKNPATTECRASAGVCDVAESCDGTSDACPADAKNPATTECRASAGVCDVAESCDGTSNACPADSFQAPTTTCRAIAGVCDVAESCTGGAAECPPDSSSPTTCRAYNVNFGFGGATVTGQIAVSGNGPVLPGDPYFRYQGSVTGAALTFGPYAFSASQFVDSLITYGTGTYGDPQRPGVCLRATDTQLLFDPISMGYTSCSITFFSNSAGVFIRMYWTKEPTYWLMQLLYGTSNSTFDTACFDRDFCYGSTYSDESGFGYLIGSRAN